MNKYDWCKFIAPVIINYTGIKKDEVDFFNSDDYSQLSNRHGIVIKFREQLQQLEGCTVILHQKMIFQEHTSGSF